jgi:hypothetical protein
MLTAGAEAIADIDTLRQQSGLLGPVASAADGLAGPNEITLAALRGLAFYRFCSRGEMY